MTEFNPAVLHWWAAEGTGEITRHWFRPVCNREVRRKFPNSERHTIVPPDGSEVCGLCSSIANHPAGKGRVTA